MLMMHYSASITSLASPNPMFTAFPTLALERSPPPSSGSPYQKVLLSDHHTRLTHFVRPKSSSLAYRLAFVITFKITLKLLPTRLFFSCCPCVQAHKCWWHHVDTTTNHSVKGLAAKCQAPGSRSGQHCRK